MADFGFFAGKDDLAVENLISQAKDLYVLEQVATINCSGFTDSSLPTNLETRFRRLKSLPVSRPDPVSSSKKLLSHSKSMAGHHPEKKNHGNASSGSAFSGDEKMNLSGNKRDPSVNSRGVDFSDSGKISSSSSRFSREDMIFSGIKRNPSVNSGFEKNPRGGFGSSRISSSSFTSIDLASPSLDLDPEEGSNRKSKSKFSISWFGKLLSPSQAMCCLWRSTCKSSSPNSKKTTKSCKSSGSGEFRAEEQLKKAKIAIKESQRMQRKTEKLIKKSKALRGSC